MYTVAWFTLCYGWRVGIVKYIVIVTATAAPTSDLTLPYLKLITLAYYIILPLIRPSPVANRPLKHSKPHFPLGKTEVRSRIGWNVPGLPGPKIHNVGPLLVQKNVAKRITPCI